MRRRDLLAAGLASAVGAALPWEARAEGGGLYELAKRPTNYEAPRAAFLHRVTPLDSFYLRSHHDAPALEPGAYRLELGGLFEKARTFSLADLERLPQREVEAVLQCAGNGRGLFVPRMPGVQWKQGAMGNAVWRGPRLADLLKAAGLKAGAKNLELAGADRPVLPTTPQFIRSIPVAKALHEDTIVALSMNGRPLPALHGGPARRVVPGWVGDDWTKWISRITALPGESDAFFYKTGYRVPDGPVKPGEAVPPERMVTMTTLGVKSVIAAPAEGAVIGLAGAEVSGVAFSGGAGEARVEVSTDGGRSWKDAALEKSPTKYGFARFVLPFRPAAPGRYRIAARATDEARNVQPAEPAWNPSGYRYNAVDVVEIEVRS